MSKKIKTVYDADKSAGNDPSANYLIPCQDEANPSAEISLDIDQIASAVSTRIGVSPPPETTENLAQLVITIQDNTLVPNLQTVTGVDYTHYNIVTDSETVPTYPTGFTNGPLPALLPALAAYAPETKYVYLYDLPTTTPKTLTAPDGTSGIVVEPKDTNNPTGTLTLTSGTNADTEIDWVIASSDGESGIDATETRLIDGVSGQAISIGSASGTIVGLNAGTAYTYSAEIKDNYGNLYQIPGESHTTDAAVGTAGTINFTETTNPAYEVAEDVGGGVLTVSLTLTGRSGADEAFDKTCTVSTRPLTTEGTSQVAPLSGDTVTFSAGAGSTVGTINVTLTDQSLTENNVFEVYIDDGSEGAAGGGDPTIGPNNAILVYLTGSGTTGSTGYEDYTHAATRQLVFLTQDDNDWTETTGNKAGDGMSIDGASPTAATNALTWDNNAGGLFVNIEPYNDPVYAESYDCPITLSQTGTWYVWAHMYTTGTIRSTLLSFDRNQVNISQFAKTVNLSTEEWRPVGTASGSTPTGYTVSAGDHFVNVATREANTTHWVDGVLITDDASFTPSGMAYTPSTKSSTEPAVDNPDNSYYPLPIGPITTSKVTPTFSPLDNATDQQNNVNLVMTFTGMSGLRLDPLALTVTNDGGVASGAWIVGDNTATFTLNAGQFWTNGAAVTVTGTDIGSVIDTDGVRKSISDIGVGDWNITITTPAAYIQDINFETITNIPRDVTTADVLAPNGVFHSEGWAILGPEDGNTLKFTSDPLSSGKGVVIEHGITQGNGEWNFTGKTLQTRHYDIVNPVGSTVMREVYHSMDVYVPLGYVAPSSVHFGALWSSPDRSTHGSTALDGLTRDKCRIGLNFYGLPSGYNPPYQCLALYVYHNRFSTGWYGPYWMNTIDPATRWAIGTDPAGRMSIPLGRWFQFECRLLLNTFVGSVGQSDGEIQAWVDGQLVCNATGQRILAEDHALGINMITHGLVYGGDNAIAVNDDKIYIDNMRYSTFPMTH